MSKWNVFINDQVHVVEADSIPQMEARVAKLITNLPKQTELWIVPQGTPEEIRQPYYPTFNKKGQITRGEGTVIGFLKNNIGIIG